MNGIILAVMLGLPIGEGVPEFRPIEAELTGGYHAGPVYATVGIATFLDQVEFAWDYLPLQVRWDFRAGIKGKGFDCYLSRYCQHNVFGDEPDLAGLRLVLSWNSWP